ncbi:MAG TPA: gamma-glutamyl-gamma-aminobutyrate hydrolase family protein [Thermoleophilaceae bacterium]|nr:gamma-glutamyl-gamma-aminobutyrate hydrolase family protein [Thermoleophilaceae bacterium]
MRPLIGLTTSEIRLPGPDEPLPHADAAVDEVVLGKGYFSALAEAGAAPVVIPPLDPQLAPSFVAGLAGLCLSGGPDVDPSMYGAERHPKLGPTNPDVDRLEVALVREAERLGMPVLAICRGAQVLNVARGGDLIQDLPDEVGSRVIHHRGRPDDPAVLHEVTIAPDSLLARSLGRSGLLEVNSFHHQAPRRLGHGLRAVAHAADGVIEAVELPDAEFELGVQWHPEGIVDRPEQAALFRAFVAAGARYAASTASTAASEAASQRPGSDAGSSTSTTGIA